MARSSLIIGSVCLLLSGACLARPQAQVKTGISAKGTKKTSRAPATGTTPVVPAKPGTVMQSARPGQNGQPMATATNPSPANGTVPQTAPPLQQQVQQPPPRPEQMPPVPAKVSYQNGLLTVQAPNSTLGDIFNGIRSRAGIQFEGGQGASERVAATIGPAPADEVLRALLSGSRFDYVIIGDEDNADVVHKVILTPRAGGAPGTMTAAVPQQMRPGAPQQSSEDEDEDQAPAETVQPPPPVQTAPVQPQQPGDSPKTTQQLMDELKQMQQQQQQPQQINQGNPETAPLKPGAPQQGAPVIRPKLPPL